MIAESADIRFECSKCGQHLVVEAAGAGLTADCPICDTVVTVPRPIAAGRKGASAAVVTEDSRPAFADPAPDDLREELIDASMINGKLVGDLQKAREEIASLQQKVKSLGEECEHLNSSSTHTQAELKTFQTERQQFKTEFSALRQKLATTEEALAAREVQLNKARAKTAGSVPPADLEAVESKLRAASSLAAEWEAKALAAQTAHDELRELREKVESTEKALVAASKLAAAREAEINAAVVALEQSQRTAAEFKVNANLIEQTLEAQRGKLAAELDEQRQKLKESQARSAALDGELHKLHAKMGETESALASARETVLRLTTERVDLQRQIDDGAALVAEAGDLKALLARSGEEVRDRTEKLQLAEETGQTLTARGELLRRENDSLRRDLGEAHSGRELIELRSQLEGAEAERDRMAAQLSAVEADLRALAASESAARAELEKARTERDDAVEKAESLRESRATLDNQVLRGIVARLNADLSQRAAEVIRLKRGRYGLKIAYALFALGLLGVVAFALTVLPHALKQ